MKDNNYTDNNYGSQEEESGFDFRAFFSKMLYHWKWFAASVVICLACAFIYLRYG